MCVKLCLLLLQRWTGPEGHAAALTSQSCGCPEMLRVVPLCTHNAQVDAVVTLPLIATAGVLTDASDVSRAGLVRHYVLHHTAHWARQVSTLTQRDTNISSVCSRPLKRILSNCWQGQTGPPRHCCYELQPKTVHCDLIARKVELPNRRYRGRHPTQVCVIPPRSGVCCRPMSHTAFCFTPAESSLAGPEHLGSCSSC